MTEEGLVEGTYDVRGPDLRIDGLPQEGLQILVAQPSEQVREGKPVTETVELTETPLGLAHAEVEGVVLEVDDRAVEHRGQPLARLSDGTIAGAASNLFDDMKNAIRFGVPTRDAILSASLIPAKEAGCDRDVGAIAPGRFADFSVCDSALTLKEVYLGGKLLPKEEVL